MKRRALFLLLLPAACANPGPPDAAFAPPPGAIHPAPRPGAAAAVPPGANTAEAFDTTTRAERATAKAPASPQAAALLGQTVATLGDPADPGIWLATPLAKAPGAGRVVSAETGNAIQLELRPLDAPATAGSRISLAALRLLGLPLAGLHPLEVYGE